MSTSKIVPIGGRRIIVNFLAGAMQTVVSLFAGFFSSRWLLLNIGEVDIGLFNVIGGIVALAGVFGVFWGRALFRLYGYTLGENVDIQEKLNQYFNTGLLGCGIVIALLASIGYPLGVYSIHYKLTVPSERLLASIWSFRFTLVSTVIIIGCIPYTTLFSAKQIIAPISGIHTVLTLLLLAFSYYSKYIAEDRLIWYSAIMALTVALPPLVQLVYGMKKFPECRICIDRLWSSKRFKELAIYGFWIYVGNFPFNLQFEGMKIFLNLHWGPRLNTAYALGNNLIARINNISGSLHTAICPAITTIAGGGNKEQLEGLVIRTCKFLMLILSFFYLPLHLELKYVLTLWLKEPPTYTYEFCCLVAVATFINSMSVPYALALESQQKIGIYKTISCFQILLFWPILFALFYFYKSPLIVVIAMILTNIGNVFVNLFYCRKMFGFSINRWFLNAVLPVFACLVLPVLIGGLLHLLLPSSFIRFVLTGTIIVPLFIGLAYRFALAVDEQNSIRMFFLRKKLPTT